MKRDAKRLWRLVTGFESVGSEDARLLVGVRAFCVPRGLVVVLLHVCDLNVTFGFEDVVLRLVRVLGCCCELPGASDSVIALELLPPAISDARLVIVRSIVGVGMDDSKLHGRKVWGEILTKEQKKRRKPQKMGLCHRYTPINFSRKLVCRSSSSSGGVKCRARSARS